MWTPGEHLGLIKAVEFELAMNRNGLINIFEISSDWNKIAEKVENHSGDECKKEWYRLIQQFLLVLGPMKYDHLNQIDWWAMERMAFMGPYVNEYKR